MMTREEAITWYKAIVGGSGLDRYSCLDVLRRGVIPEAKWEDPLFGLGQEYGVLIALIEVFHLTREDLEL